MSEPSRRNFLLGASAVGAGSLLAACTSNTPAASNNNQNVAQGAGSNNQPGKPVKIGFSAPAADHGWIAAITKNAKAQAGRFSEVTFNATEGTNDVNQQIAQVESLINSKVDVLVILPHDGKALTAVAQQAMDKGIPVVNLDRIFDTALAYRIWIGGDNYRMGVNAANYIAAEMKKKGVSNPIIGEVAGIDSLPLTQERSKGFRDALGRSGFKVGPYVSGVMAAIDSANRKEFVMVGGAGSKNMMDKIKADNSVIKATVLYSPSMSSSAVVLARLLGQAKGLGDLAEHEIPAQITTYSAVVTKENVDQYSDVGFES